LQLHASALPTFKQASPAWHVVPPQMQSPVAASQVPLAPERLQRALFPAHPQSISSGAAHFSPLPPPPRREQSLPQPPQSVVAVRTSVSHPSSASGAGGATQLPQPSWQVEVHWPSLHERLSTLLLEHARPQPPQLSTSLPVGDSHPSSGAGASGCVQLANPD
jgi:hypothetical protein